MWRRTWDTVKRLMVDLEAGRELRCRRCNCLVELIGDVVVHDCASESNGNIATYGPVPALSSPSR